VGRVAPRFPDALLVHAPLLYGPESF
jgi:hypothetical protein